MSQLDVYISGDKGKNASITRAHVHPFTTGAGKHHGLVTLTHPFLGFAPNVIPFLNNEFGNQMNQNIAFGGTPELLFDGGSGGTEWTGTSGDGQWDFADGGKVTVEHAPNDSEALFTDGTTTDSSGFTALTGNVDLDNYTPATQKMEVQFRFEGTPLGTSVNIDDYIDTANFGEQPFAIPITNFGLAGVTVDEFTITIRRTGGHNSHVKFDDFQLEETGTSAVFKVFASNGDNFHVKKLKFMFADALAGTLSNGTMPALSYNKILGLSALTNGITVQIVQNGKVDASINMKQLSDLLSIGATITETISDGTNTMVSLEIEFSEPIILKNQSETTSFISVTVSDNLSGLLLFTGLARGAYEN